MSIKHDEIHVTASLYCDSCSEWDRTTISPESSISFVCEMFEDEGWVFDETDGWVCPACSEEEE